MTTYTKTDISSGSYLTDEAQINYQYQCPYCGTPIAFHTDTLGMCEYGCVPPEDMSDMPELSDFSRPQKLFLVHKMSLRIVQAKVSTYVCTGSAGYQATITGIIHPVVVWPVRHNAFYYVATSYDEACEVAATVITQRLRSADTSLISEHRYETLKSLETLALAKRMALETL